MRCAALILSLLVTSTVFGQDKIWSFTADSASFFSSPRFSDLNGDGVKDVVYGGGTEAIPSSNGVIALNGKTGELLWKIPTPTQIYTSALFQDITGDGTMDVFIGGRAGEFYAINGRTGDKIWSFWPKEKGEARLHGILNFFATQWVEDQDADGMVDLLLANGGDYLAMPADMKRKTGQLMILSGKTGQILLSQELPEDREIYYAPHLLSYGTKNEVIFGTGGETIDGALWKIDWEDLLKKKIKKSEEIIRDDQKGFILNTVISDITKDGVPDYLNARMNATLCAINGAKNEELWSHSFDGYECYVTPSLGHFNDDRIPDFFTIIAKGSFPMYSEWRLIAIDGNSGQILLDEKSGFNQFSPAVCADLTSDGIDEIIFVENNLLNPQQFTVINQVRVIDLARSKTHYLGKAQKGMSMASTPSLCDSNGDGSYELFYAVSEMGSDPSIMQSTVHVIDLKQNIEQVTWPGYLGPLENGILKNF